MPILAALIAIAGAVPSSADDTTSVRKAWVSRYDGPQHRSDIATEVAISPNGGTVFVSGRSYRARGGDFATVAYDASDGSELWTARYNGDAHLHDDVVDIGVTPDGGTLFVTGTAREPGTLDDLVTIAYDTADGSELWIAKHDGPFHGYDVSAGLVVDPDGSRVYVGGSVQISVCGDDFDPCEYNVVLLAYDAMTGTPVWTKQDGGLGGNARVASIVGTSDGDRIFVTTQGAEIMAYDTANGSRSWATQADVFAPDSLAASPDGETVFVGAEDFESYMMLAYSAQDGTELWRVSRGSQVFLGRPFLAVLPAENTVFLAGENRSRALLWALDGGTGQSVWRSVYDGPGAEDYLSSITVSADGAHVFIAGGSRRRHSFAFSYATAAFDTADGTLLWSRRYGRHGDHFAAAIAAGPDGEVYVTGDSEGPSGWADYATVKYTDGD